MGGVNLKTGTDLSRKIALILVVGLGIITTNNQNAIACKLCNDEAQKAVLRGQGPSEKIPTNLPSNNAAFAAGKPGGSKEASGNSGANSGIVIRNGGGQSSVGNLIPGYLDSIGREPRAPAASRRNSRTSGTADESDYANLDYPISDSSGSEDSSNSSDLGLEY